MAMETIQAVRQAELNAAQMEKDAIHQKELILTEAQQKAKTLVASKTKEAQELMACKLSDAETEGAKKMEATIQKAEKEVLLLKELVTGKEQEAIQFVLANII